MDGSTAAFQLDTMDFSASVESGAGILYIEDFDLEPGKDADVVGDASDISQSDPALTPADLEAAHESGRLAGLQEALDDARLVQTQIQAAATQSLADALVASQATLTKVAREAADEGVRILVALLQASVPALMERHAAAEMEAVLRALLPGIWLEPELRIRSHPASVEYVHDLIAGLLPSGTVILSVAADGALAPGDVQIAWQDGTAVRDTRAVWAAICKALTPINLPAIEELCHGCGF